MPADAVLGAAKLESVLYDTFFLSPYIDKALDSPKRFDLA